MGDNAMPGRSVNWEIHVQMGVRPKAKGDVDVIILLDLGDFDIA